jgi:hypothetical protein
MRFFKSSTQCNHNSSTAQVWKYGMPALINFQFHLIARIDNTTQLILDHIRVHDSFDNALKTRLNWSKNVRDERDAPWQVILGCMNPVFCVFISLGLWLESNLKSNPSAIASPYVFSFPTTLQCLAVVKRQKTLRRVSSDRMCLSVKCLKWQDYWGAIQFADLQQHMLENVGYPKTTRIYKVVWKGKGRVSDVYDDVELSYPDCKVAEKLCFGGPCFYLIDNTVVDVTIMTTFILTKVVPNICQRLPTSACLVLGKAVVWLIFSSFANNFVSSMDYCDQVKAELVETGVVIEEGKNPILKMPVLVSGNQGTVVYIDEIPVVAPVDNVEVAATAGGGGEQINLRVLENTRTFGGDQMRNYILQLQSGILSLRRENIELRNEFERRFDVLSQLIERGFATVNGNVRRVAMQPV